MNCKPSNSCCSPTQQWKEILLNTQDKAIQAYNLAQQALDEIENLQPGGGSVQSVNNELPDEDGNVTIDTGVMTVNGVSPDADGEVTITAGSNITITPDAGTNSIEISASGNAEWVEDTTYKWAYLLDNGETTKEILIWKRQSGTNYSEEMVYIPEGTPASGYSVLMEYLHIDGTIGVTKVTLSNLLMDFTSGSSSVTTSQSTISTYQSGNGIDQKVYVTKNFSQISISANNFHIYVR